MPLDLVLEVTWRVPAAPAFLVGFAILAWALASGALAFTGSQRSGQHEYHFPRRDPEVADEPVDTELPEDTSGRG